MLNITEYEAMMMLGLSNKEREELSELFEVMTNGFTALEQVDTDGVEPLVTVLDRYNVLREDVAEKLVSKDELLANAPQQQDGYFQVPETL